MVFQVVHSLHISRFMENKSQLTFQKQDIFIRATSGGLITLRNGFENASVFCIIFLVNIGIPLHLFDL